MTSGVWVGAGAPPDRLAGAIAAIGNFDGVHRGHKALLAQARDRARAERRPLLMITFEPHPRTVFRPETPVFRLTPAPVRRDLAAGQGCDGVVELAFDRAFASQSADAFIHDLLLGQLRVGGVVVGSDFAFGKGREGDGAQLKAAFSAKGLSTIAVEPVTDARGEIVSSSRIRAALEAGHVETAYELLGHRWFVRGEIVHGDKRGRLLGYPTANMLLAADNRLRHGIYAVSIRIDGVWRPAVASFGRRPTFDDGAPRLETFVFDFDGDLYGKTVDVAFAGWIRGEEKFADLDALIAQMDRDSVKARQILEQGTVEAGP